MNEKPVMFSGIKPTGDLHIGNYFGAIRQIVELAASGTYQPYIMVVDYHGLNTMQDADEMRRRTREVATGFLACGLDPKHAVLAKQSEVPAHTELAWIFDTITTMPYLMRAHAYKDAEAKGREVSVGTFNYPMLMAADILLYDTSLVPVGQDQKQHIEYARDTAEKFNRVFKTDTFRLPEAYIMANVAVVPGTDGQKMSKSYGNTIPLFASREEIIRRVMSIVTDSSDSTSSPQAGHRPQNVYAIHKLVRDEKELEVLYEEHKGKYKDLKEALIEDLDAFIAPMRARYEELRKDPGFVDMALAAGGREARSVSEAKMQQVRKAVGVV